MAKIDLEGFVKSGMSEVFEKMLSMEIETADPESLNIKGGSKVVGSVSFAGDLNGSVNIMISDDFAKELAAGMLGLEPEEIESEEEVDDVIGEMSNMIGGYLKSRFCDAGFPCELSIPSITRGKDFKMESLDYDVHKKVGFTHEKGNIIVDVFVKTGK